MGAPNLLVPLALVAFLLLAFAAFGRLGPRRAVLWTLFGGWLFVPHFDERATFLVLNSKAMFVPAIVLLASLVLDGGRWMRFRLRLLDLPIAVLCAAPFATALHNGLGLYEAAAASFEASTVWGAPYLLGRAYLGGLRSSKDLAVAFVGAAIVYVPFCLWEIRMSPQLQYALYGFRSENFSTIVRFGGFRPTVFMQAGLAVALFMALGTLVAYWLWRTGAVRHLAGVPLGWLTLLLAATTILCKSTGALLLLAAGIALLEVARRLRGAALVLAVAAVPALYCAARISGWGAEAVVALARAHIDEHRAASLQFRVHNERLLLERAMVRPWLGWGRFGRALVRDENGNSLAITDSLWILVLGIGGLVALLALWAVLALPPVLLARTFPLRSWAHPRVAPPAALAVALLLWTIDDLLNAMVTPIYPAIAGALVTFVLASRAARAREAAPAPSPVTAAGGGPPPRPAAPPWGNRPAQRP